jgi:hypothetical protein
MKSKILFVHLPRTAGTFIRFYGKETKYINYYANYKQRDGHLPASKIDDPDKWFKFGLIRNPYDWYVSQYHYFGRESKFVPERGVFEGVDGGVYGEDFRLKFPTFSDWLIFGTQQNNEKFWLSNIYKYMFFNDEELCLLNYIGKYEDLYDEVNKVLKYNDIEPKINIEDFEGYRNSSKHEPYKNYYNVETKGIVKLMDIGIINKYGYIF